MKKHKKEKIENKRRKFKQFTLDERIKIEIRYRDGWSLRRTNPRASFSPSPDLHGRRSMPLFPA
ncbi:MAG: hypothetical protein AAB868_02590 [Patescibacteria group bacterium]